MTRDASPTLQDIRNAAVRQAIAERQQEEYDACLHHATHLLGPGYRPSCRYYLLDKDVEDAARRTGERPTPAATVYMVRHERTGEKRWFVLKDGEPVAVASMEAGFGDILFESHPTRRVEVQGESVPTHRYSLCWAPIETYKPKSAEALAALRESREHKRQQQELAKAVEDMPLFAEQIVQERAKLSQPKGGWTTERRQ